MKMRVVLSIVALMCVVTMSAQSYVQKHKHGDWYFGLGVGFSQSLAENAVSTDFIFHQKPSVDLLLGHNFTPAFGFRLTGGLNMQVSRCSKVAEAAMPDVFGNGRYNFNCLTATASGIVNLTNVFFGYEVERPLTWSVAFGAGLIKTYGFDEKIQAWNAYPYYPVNGDGGNYIVGHLGVHCDVRLSEPWDINIELRTNATDNKYNGVANGNSIDFYLDLMVNFVYHLKNGKQQLRRFRPPKRVAFVDPILIDRTKEYVETVRYGESMYTQVPFYSGFFYLNATTTKRVEVVARFLRSHPEVNLNIVGHPDIIADEDLEYHTQLARKRAEAVKDVLVTKYGIRPERLRVSYEDTTLQPYKSVREWVPAVHFVMEPAQQP